MVERLADDAEVGRVNAPEPLEGLGMRTGEVRVTAEEHGVGEEVLVQGARHEGGGAVVVIRGGGLDDAMGVHDADAGRGARAADRLDGESVGEQLVVHGGERVEPEAGSGRVRAGGVAAHRRERRRPERDPVGHAVRERLRGEVGEVAEAERGVAVEPAAAILQLDGQVVVVQGGAGADPRGQQRVDQLVVERDALAAEAPARLGLDPRPGEGEGEDVDAELGRERDVLPVPLHVPGAALRVAAVGHRAGPSGERVPHGLGSAALVRAALDLGRARADPDARAAREETRQLGRRRAVGGGVTRGQLSQYRAPTAHTPRTGAGHSAHRFPYHFRHGRCVRLTRPDAPA